MIPEDMPSLSADEYLISPDHPDAYEQMMIELINRARMDPLAEAARQGTSLGEGVSADPSQPLAVDPALDRAASLHSFNMIDRDFFAHNDPDTGTSPFDRMRAEGYNYSSAGENIGIIWSFSDPFTQSRIESHHNNLWNSLGHRVNLMRDRYSEVGIGYFTGSYTLNGTTYPGTSVITQNFGDRGRVFLTGVVIDDLDGDEFYDVGEGQGDVRITVYNDTVALGTSTWDAGGYSIQLQPGTFTVVFEGGDLDGHYVTTVTIADENVKLDVIEDRDAIQDGGGGDPPPPDDPLPPDPEPDDPPPPGPDPDPVLVEGDGGRDRLSGTDADEIFVSGGGKVDKITSGGGADIFVYADETSNGVRERDVIYDYDPTLDAIALADGVEVVDSYNTRRGHLVIELSGDGDQIIIRDNIAFDQITFIDGVNDLLV